MVRSIHKTKMAFSIVLASAASVAMASSVYAENPQNLDFQVNVAEVLTISVTNPTAWASGDLNNYNSTTGKYESGLLRNKVTVSGSTNNPVGFSVSMYTNNTELRNLATYNSTNTDTYIPTLSEATLASSFPVNNWGYSVNDTAAGSSSANYYALRTSSNPIELINTRTSTPTTYGTQDVYFGAKADSGKQSGIYAQTVYFAAVTGTIDTENPVIPVNPSTSEPNNEVAHYNANTGNTTYTTRTTSGDTLTTTTTVAKGDVTSTYANAAGVTSMTGGQNNTGLATALGVAAAVAATSGGILFAMAKHKKDEGDN